MNTFGKILKAWKKMSFGSPRPCQILIFDRANHEQIVKFALSGQSYWVLPARGEQYFMSLSIALSLVKYLAIIFLLRPMSSQSGSPLKLAYYLSVIAQVKPRIITTFIDTVSHFYSFPDYYNSTYISFQNGTRWHTLDYPIKIRIPHYFCLSYFDIDTMRQHQHRIDQFYPVGTLKGDYARRALTASIADKNYDICMISGWRDSIMLGDNLPEVKPNVIQFSEYVRRFLSETSYSACFASSVSSAAELDYYQRLFAERVDIFKNSPQEMTTYQLMLRSKVSVSTWSTAAVEAMGWGKRILFTNYTENVRYSFPLRKTLMPVDKSYEAFKEKLLQLLNEAQAAHDASPDHSSQYMMSYPPRKPNYTIVQEAFQRVLDSDKVWDGSESIVSTEDLLARPPLTIKRKFTLEEGLEFV